MMVFNDDERDIRDMLLLLYWGICVLEIYIHLLRAYVIERNMQGIFTDIAIHVRVQTFIICSSYYYQKHADT